MLFHTTEPSARVEGHNGGLLASDKCQDRVVIGEWVAGVAVLLDALATSEIARQIPAPDERACGGVDGAHPAGDPDADESISNQEWCRIGSDAVLAIDLRPKRVGVPVLPECVPCRRVERDQHVLVAVSIHREESAFAVKNRRVAAAKRSLPESWRPGLGPGLCQGAGFDREVAARSSPTQPVLRF